MPDAIDKPSGGTLPWFLRYSKRALLSCDSEKQLDVDTSKSSVIEETISVEPK